MPCYAMACRRVLPCPSQLLCERTWHACTPPATNTIWHWTCGNCRHTWTHHADDGTWYRDDLREG